MKLSCSQTGLRFTDFCTNPPVSFCGVTGIWWWYDGFASPLSHHNMVFIFRTFCAMAASWQPPQKIKLKCSCSIFQFIFLLITLFFTLFFFFLLLASILANLRKCTGKSSTQQPQPFSFKKLAKGIRWNGNEWEQSYLPKHMSNGADADDIKCLLEGDSHSVTTIKLDERLEPGNNELIWFPNAPFRPLMQKSRTTCAFSASLRRLCEYSSFLIKAWIDM